MSKDTELSDMLSKYRVPLSDDDTFSFLDDYSNREEYHILKKFFSIKKIGRFGILKAKKYNSNNKVKFLLNKYYFISKWKL